jgi:tetratricopeptide (TPR) repeat protein
VGGGDGLDPDAVLDLLVALTEHSLVQAEGESPRRYRMLEALCLYGRARLDPVAAEAAARRHATHFAHLGASAAGRVGHAGAEAAGEPLVPYQWDLHAASDWAAARGETDLALELATALGAFHHLVGTVTLGRELIDRALALPGGDPARRIGAMRWQIGLLLCELRLPAAAEAIAAAGEVIRRHGTPGDLDELRGFEAQLALCRGDFEAADRAGEDLYPRLLRRGERYFAAYAMWTRGHVALVRGDPEAAARHFAVVGEHMVEVHDICALDNASAAMADALRAAGREDEAADVCARTLAIAADRPLGERNTYLLHEAALAAAGAGEVRRAAELAGSAMTGARRDPVSIGPWHAPTARGDVAQAAGDRAGARREHEAALALALQVRDEVGPSLPVDARIALSHLRLADLADRPDDAGRHVLLALEHARASGAPAILAAVEGAAAEHAEMRRAARGDREPVTVP